MILTVTLNFALDVTYHTGRFERGETTRIETFARQAGGKGVNVARVLHGLGRGVAVTGVVGGRIGQAALSELRSAGIRDELVEIKAESRIRAATAADRPTLLDADVEFLKRGVEAGPTIVKVNRAELEAVAGGATIWLRRRESCGARVPGPWS